MFKFSQLFACSLREEPSQSSSLLQRMVVLPANESFQEFTSTAVRIAPALSSVAGITTTTANSVLTFGKASKIALPHLVKSTTGQVKQLQALQSKPTTISTLLYSPNIVIKSELLTDSSSVVTLPRISSTVAGTPAPISAVQDASNPLARHLGLKLATHINALPKDGTDKASLSSKASLLRTTQRTVFESSCSRDGRTSEVSLDNRLENIIKKFGKEAQTPSGRVTSVQLQQTTEKSFLPSSFFSPRLSCVRNSDPKETIVVKKQPEFINRSTHTTVANGLLRCVPTFSQSQPMFLIEKTRRNITAGSFDSSGIRIIKKSKVSTGGLPQPKFDKPPATTAAESSPLMSLKKLVAGVGLLKSSENEIICLSPTMSSNRETALGFGACEKAAVCDQLQGESLEETENDGAIEADPLGGAMSSSKSLLDHANLEVQEKRQENETRLNGDSFRPVFENSVDKEVVCHPSDSVESEGRLSPYSDETSRSLLMNDGTSDYHVSDEEQVLPTGTPTRHEIKGSKYSPGEPSQMNAASALGSDAQPSNEEPTCKKMRVATSTGENAQYEGRTYLARLMELPPPPNYGHDYPWDLITEDRKRKGKIAIKRKRKK